MIRPEDAQFHPPASDDRMWAETNFFGFEIPDSNMHAGVYALFRPNLGVVNSAIFINSRRVAAAWETDYWESRAYLPMPEGRNLLDYRLDNGLTVRCHKPNELWDISYESPEATIDLRFEALMPGFDIHDPDMDPRAKVAARGDLSASAAYAGHFDMTGRITGEVVVHGTRHAVDWFSTMDHSWGVRQEVQPGVMTWLQAHISSDLSFHVMFDFDPTVGPDQVVDLALTHGYVMDHGEGIGLKAATGRTERSGLYPERITLELVDARDRRWTLHGEAQTTFPCQYWPGSMAFMVLNRWTVGDRTGYGTVTDFFDLKHLPRLYA
ncbi:MAG TPA: hypothetical protein VGP90_14650 [Acidimicrobiia bacterium]|nr:hypothetical protein [Acidimicrobiia bacterium]